MANEKKRTLQSVYDGLKSIQGERDVDFGMDNMSYDDFQKKYGTGAGVGKLYDALSAISDEAGLDFGIGERGDWVGSFGFGNGLADADMSTAKPARTGFSGVQDYTSTIGDGRWRTSAMPDDVKQRFDAQEQEKQAEAEHERRLRAERGNLSVGYSAQDVQRKPGGSATTAAKSASGRPSSHPTGFGHEDIFSGRAQAVVDEKTGKTESLASGGKGPQKPMGPEAFRREMEITHPEIERRAREMERQKAVEKDVEEATEYAGHMLDGSGVVEKVWKEADEREARQRAVNEKTERNLLMTAVSNKQAHLKEHDIDTLFDTAWERLNETGNEESMEGAPDRYKTRDWELHSVAGRSIVEIADALKKAGISDDEARKKAEAITKAKVYIGIYEQAVKANTPGNWGSYLLDKINGQLIGAGLTAIARKAAGTSGDLAAAQDALARYAGEHGTAALVADVLAMTADPAMALGGGVAKLGVGAATKVGGMVGRKALNTFGGRLATGALGGSLNFATFEGLNEFATQMAIGGELSQGLPGTMQEGTLQVGAYNPSAVAGKALHGAGMGAAVGVAGGLFGEAGKAAARAVKSTAGKAAVRTPISAAGMLTEATIFAAPEMYASRRGYNEMIEQLQDPESEYYIEDEAERSKRTKELEEERDKEIADVWKQNVATIGAFKVQGALKSAPEVIASLRGKRGNSRVGMETRLRSLLDGRDESMALTSDEIEELKNAGYGDFSGFAVKALRNLKEHGKEAETKQLSVFDGVEREDAEGEAMRQLYTNLVNDDNISQTARAKVYYYLTGHRLPMMPIVRTAMDEADGRYTVSSYGPNGEVVTRRTFEGENAAEAAEKELGRVNRVAEVNAIELGERRVVQYQYEEAIRLVAREIGVNAEDVYEVLRGDKPGLMTPEYKAQQQDMRKAVLGMYALLRVANEQTGDFTPEGARAAVESEYGVNINDALAKEPGRRSEAEQKAIEEYTRRLYEGNWKPKEEDRGGEPWTIDVGSEVVENRVSEMTAADKQALWQRMQDERTRTKEDEDLWNAVESDIVNRANQRAEEEISEAKTRLHKNGTEIKVRFNDGLDRYIVDGKVETKSDGTLNLEASDDAIVYLDPRDGQRKMGSIKDIAEIYHIKEGTVAEAEISDKYAKSAETEERLIPYGVGVGYRFPSADGKEMEVVSIEAGRLKCRTTEGAEIELPVEDAISLFEAARASEQGAENQPAAPAAQAEQPKETQPVEPPAAEQQPVAEGPVLRPVNGGDPGRLETGMRLRVKGDDGQTADIEVTGRYRAVGGKAVPDADGPIVEYFDGEAYHRENEERLKGRVEGVYEETERPEERPAETPAAEATEAAETAGQPQRETATPSEGETAEQATGIADGQAEASADGAEAAPAAAPASDDVMPMRKVTVGRGKDKTEVEEPDFAATTPERGYRYIYQEKGYPAEVADEMVKTRQANAAETLADLQKKEPKMSDKSINGSMAMYDRLHGEWQAQVEAAEKEAAYWDGVRRERNRELLAEAEERAHKMAEWEARKKREQEAYEEQLRREAEAREEQERMAEERMKEGEEERLATEKETEEAEAAVNWPIEDDAEAMEIMNDLEPHSLEEIAATMLARAKTKEKLDPEAMRAHTGYGTKDYGRKMPFVFAKKENGGVSAERYGELIEEKARELGVVYDDLDANAGLNALLNVLGEVEGKSDLTDYIRNRRRAEAEEYHEARLKEAVAIQVEENWLAKHGGMTREEYASYINWLEDAVERGRNAITDEEFNQLFDTDHDRRTEEQDERGDRGGAEAGGTDEPEAGSASTAEDAARGDGEAGDVGRAAGAEQEAVHAGAGSEPQPVGRGVFGDIYDQFRGKVKEAFARLMKDRSGDYLGVFHRDGVGDIDLVWGDKGGGWEHILHKHVGAGKSFATAEDAIAAIEDIINNGEKTFENGDKIVFNIGGKQVTIRKNYRKNGKKIAAKNWVLTAYDEMSADSESPVAVNQGKAGKATDKFDGKGTNNSATGQEKVASGGETAGLKEQRGGERAGEVSPWENELRDGLAGLMKEAGIDVVEDVEEGQRIVDEERERMQMSRGKKRALETVSISGNQKHRRTVVSSADGAKIRKNLVTLAEKIENLAQTPLRTFIGDLAKALEAEKQGSKSEYATFITPNGREVTIRLANHNATVSNFDRRGEDEGISIVIAKKREGNTGIDNDGTAHVIEYFYTDTELRKAFGKPLADIVRSIKEALSTGEYVDPTGLAEREEVNSGRMRMQKGEGSPVFYSNAERAVEGIKQEKATAEQWKAMLQKSGGLKAGEDKWLGLSEWLDSHKGESLTRQQVLDYIRENQIKIEEAWYAEIPEAIQKEFEELVEAVSKYNHWSVVGDIVRDKMREKYGDDFDIAFSVDYDDKTPVLTVNDREAASVLGEGNAIYETRLQYTTEGLKNKREVALTVPTIESWDEHDEVHFGEAGGGRAVAWVRFGETTDADGKRVLVIDEIQSKRHQEGREKGYSKDKNQLSRELNEAEGRREELARKRQSEHGTEGWEEYVKSDEYREAVEAVRRAEEALHSASGIPDAPFEKNWHELAMKWALRYAAENGYDKVAWTTGEQQAERYNIGNVVGSIDILPLEGKEGEYRVITHSTYGRNVEGATGNMSEEQVLATFGKDLGGRLLDGIKKQPYGYNTQVDGLRIGGEGMKGFYDQMLPRFMDKYGKKWGVKTGEVELPDVEESGRRMWSVDVTPEMRESVKEGQAMFFLGEDGEVLGFVKDGRIFIDPRVATAETAVHEYAHLWGEALRKANPEAWERLKSEMRGQEDVMEWVRSKYPEIEDEDALMEEVFAHYGGRRGAERLRAEMAAEMAKQGDPVLKARVAAVFHKVRQLLERFWTLARDLFAGKVKGVEKLTAEDFADMMLGDLLRGVNPMKEVEAANRRFNEELQRFGKGEKGELHLGAPGEILRASGLGDAEMYIKPGTLREHLDRHGLTVDDIRDLPEAMNKPLMVYEWGTKAKSLIVVTELTAEDGRKITAAVKMERQGKRVEVNEIASIHGKEAERMLSELKDEESRKVHGGVANAIKYIGDKKKVLDWLGLDPPKGSPSLTDQELSIANVVNNFENPQINLQVSEPGGGMREQRRTVNGLNSGYTTRDDGSAISVRAEDAEANGKYTEGRFKSRYKVGRADFEALRELGIVRSDEWHHTGRNYKKSDYWEWGDHAWRDYTADDLAPEGSLSARYAERKKEIGRLAKEYAEADWEHEPLKKPYAVPDYEQYRRNHARLHTYDLLTEQERAEQRARHEFVSGQRDEKSGWARKMEHKAIDERYLDLAESHIDDEAMRAEYEREYGERIEANSRMAEENEAIAARNARTRGKEYLLERIGEEMGLDAEDVRRRVDAAVESRRAEEREARRRQAGRDLTARIGAIHEEVKRAQAEYVERLIGEGKARRVERVREEPENFVEEKAEMNGKYGWFEATSRYNLPVYHSGIVFEDKAGYDGYRQIEDASIGRIKAEYERYEKETGIGESGGIRYRDGENSEGGAAAPATAEAKRRTAAELSERLHTAVEVEENAGEISDDDPAVQARKRRAKGWYDPRTGKVHVVLENNRDAADVAATVAHETVCHKGLRELVGEARFGEFLDEVYRHLKGAIKEEIDRLTGRAFMRGTLGGEEDRRTYEECRREQVEEYMARLEEKDAADYTAAERTLWEKIKEAVRKVLDKFLGDLKLPSWFTIGDNELRYMLWRSRRRLESGDYVGRAMDAAKRRELGLDGVVFSEERGRGGKTQAERVAEINAEKDEIERKAKADGTWKKAPNGAESRLDDRQWVEVRTQAFKAMFGDWEKAALADYLVGGDAVATLTGREFEKDELPITKKVADYYANKYDGKIERAGVGTILLDERSVKDSIAHGLGRSKSAAFAAVPEIISDGRIVDRQDNWKGRGYGSVTFAAPVKIGEENYVGIVVANEVEHSDGTHRFYLHEVVLQKNLQEGEFKTGMNTGSHLGDVAKVLKNILSAKSNVSVVVDENGEPLVVYHGSRSGEQIRIFRTPTFFSSDKGTADMFKREADCILQVNGQKVAIDDITAKQIAEFLTKGDYEPEDLYDWGDVADVLRETLERGDDLDRELLEDTLKYAGIDIPASGIESISVERVPDVYECYVNMRNPLEIDFGGKTWGEAGTQEMEAEVRDAAKNGYDGVIVRNIREGGFTGEMRDGGEAPISTDYIPVSPEQIKSATENEGTFDPANADIRFRDPGEDDAGEESIDELMRDGSMGMWERTTLAKARIAERNRESAAAKREAMEAIGENLADLSRAMGLQREYDRGTVKRVADLARVLIGSGQLDGLGKGEVKRLLSAVKNATGKEDTGREVQTVLDIMVDNQLRRAEEELHKLESVKGSKVDARGVVVQGKLDTDGQETLRAFKEGRQLQETDLEEAIADAQERMTSADAAVAGHAKNEYAGLLLAQEYAERIGGSKADERNLRRELESRHAGTDHAYHLSDEYRQYKASVEDSIRRNKLERLQAYREFTERLSGDIAASMEAARAYMEAEAERVREIQHNANSDMEGRELKGHKEDTRLQRLNESAVMRLGMCPLATYDQMLRLFGRHSLDGKGYLYDRFMRGWQDATDGEWEMKRRYYKKMDDKAREIFGKKFKGVYKYLKDLDDDEKGLDVRYWDGADYRVKTLKQGQLGYLYAVEKMPMGRATNRRMGLTDEAMETITAALDPKFREYIDWVQEELLPELGRECNEVHRRMFGADMDSIDNYFPFVRDKEDVGKKDTEPGAQKQPKNLISTTTGAIKKRKASTAIWDLAEIDFLDVLAGHVDEMSKWSNFAELNRDLGVLNRYKRFRQQVRGMHTIYGGGDRLLEEWEKLCAIATGAYVQEDSIVDHLSVQIMKGAALNKIAFRPFTAMKQLLSLPAFWGDANPVYMLEDMASLGLIPWYKSSTEGHKMENCIQWAWRNMPEFRKRWQSRTAGDYRLRSTQYDDKWWTDKIMQKTQWGMIPNMSVDAWTIALGSHAVYRTAKDRYLRWGFEEEKAERLAIQDAQGFNKSQQSSEAAYLSTVQASNTASAVTGMLFRNSSTSYTRETVASVRNLERMAKGEVTPESVARQMLRLKGVKTYGQVFDEELRRQIDGTLEAGHIYSLGRPGGILQSAGFPDAPIELSAARLAEKARQENHPFPIAAVKGLVAALNRPLGVFRYGDGAMNVIVDLHYGGKQFLVGVHFNRNRDGMEVSDVRGLFPKDNAEWLNWISQGKATYLDKERIQALIDQQRINLAEVAYLDLESVAKILNNFENPQIPEQKISNDWSRSEWEEAVKNAKKDLRQSAVRNTVNTALYGWILPWLWRIGGLLPLFVLSGDSEEKKKALKQTAKESVFGPMEGLWFGDVQSSLLTHAVDLSAEDASWTYAMREHPFVSEVRTVLKEMDYDTKKALYDSFNILAGMTTGVSLQTISDWVSAGFDIFGRDFKMQKDWAIFAARALNSPKSQLNKIYFEEIGMTAEEAQNYTPGQLAERWARYQVKAGYMPWDWNDEELLAKKREKGMKTIKENLKNYGDKEVNAAYERYAGEVKLTGLMVKAANAAIKEDPVQGAQLWAEIHSLNGGYDYEQYTLFSGMDEGLDGLADRYLKASTPEDAALWREAMEKAKAAMVAVLANPNANERQENLDKYWRLVYGYYDKWHEMHPGAE